MSVSEEAREAPLGLTGAVAPPLLATKLAIPSPAPSLVLRPRLTARLEHASCRVVLVVAPAGSGKSSLVSQWCQQQERLRVDDRWLMDRQRQARADPSTLNHQPSSNVA